MDRFLVGRQPIFDDKFRVYGYELLFRDAHRPAVDADRMTADILVHAGLDIGLQNLVGDKLAFVNVPRSYITGELPFSLSPQQNGDRGARGHGP